MSEKHIKRKKRRELSSEQKEEIKEAFELFDSDKDGLIDYHELKVSLVSLKLFQILYHTLFKLLSFYVVSF